MKEQEMAEGPLSVYWLHFANTKKKKLQQLYEDICKQSVTAGKITRMLVRKIKPQQ